jgi:hypothetical protein
VIHGVYLRNRPKDKWHLVSITPSSESANYDLKMAKDQALLEGFEEAQTAIQKFENSFHIPVFLNEVKDYKPLFN